PSLSEPSGELRWASPAEDLRPRQPASPKLGAGGPSEGGSHGSRGTLDADDGGRVTTAGGRSEASLAPSRSRKPVSIRPSRNSGSSRTRMRNGTLVRRPSIWSARSAAARRLIANGRDSAVAITLASIGS